MAHYLDPKNDLIFKRIFAEHPKLLISFLNAIMPLKQDRYIEEIHYLPSEQVPHFKGKKNSIVDVKCIDNEKNQFIVEMQMFWSEAFNNRMVFNAGKAYIKQLNKNEDYDLLQPVYTLAIINDIFDRKTEQFYHHYQIVNRENTDEIIHGLEFVLVELPKFCPQSWEHRKLAALWLRFLSEVDENLRSLPPELEANNEIRFAAELCKEAALSPEELAIYEAFEDAIRIEKTIRNASLREGMAQGKAIGLEEGRIEGKAEGKEEVVINSRNAGIPIETIVKITGLTVEQITGILKRHKLI